MPHTREADRVTRSGHGWGRLGARHLDEALATVRRWEPDLVVVDPVEYAGRLAATYLGVPWVEHGWGIFPSPDFAVAAEKELAPEMERLGLTGPPCPVRSLDTCSPSLQRPGRVGDPMRHVPVSGPVELPGWLDEPRRRPLVCLTFGSVLPTLSGDGVLDLTARLMRSLPELDAEVVVGIDPAAAHRLRPCPPGVLSVGWLPLDHVVERCAVLVHYGASGTTMTAVAAGVPQVVLSIPVADAPDNAERIDAAGLGVVMDALDIGAEPVTAACGELLADSRWKARAVEVAAEQDDRPSPREVAAELAAAFG